MLSGPPSGQGAGSGGRTRDRRVPADLRADSQATVLPTPLPIGTFDKVGTVSRTYDYEARVSAYTHLYSTQLNGVEPNRCMKHSLEIHFRTQDRY
ncbi:hypothetical protein PoB_006763500 [Plakobranchus ocellatus]|uniref:Uncharacterized protein n=1 Tax=Plakobranchus ocellatus TaxID=259542 RepID=A0AAV4DB07_9GAST|nr:hypothetical protein PoB_006763500 [Plakobranchus ocellatus]